MILFNSYGIHLLKYLWNAWSETHETQNLAEKLKQLHFSTINITNICCRNYLALAQFCEGFFVTDKYFSTIPITHHSTQTFSLIMLQGILSYPLKKGKLLSKRIRASFKFQLRFIYFMTQKISRQYLNLIESVLQKKTKKILNAQEIIFVKSLKMLFWKQEIVIQLYSILFHSCHISLMRTKAQQKAHL